LQPAHTCSSSDRTQLSSSPTRWIIPSRLLAQHSCADGMLHHDRPLPHSTPHTHTHAASVCKATLLVQPHLCLTGSSAAMRQRPQLHAQGRCLAWLPCQGSALPLNACLLQAALPHPP
jgi:hypothetical protein